MELLRFKFLLIIILFSLSNSREHHNISNWECNSGNNTQSFKKETQINRELEKAVIRAKIWKIHSSDSLFEMTENSIETGFQDLINSYKQLGILIELYDIESIYSDSLYYFTDHFRPFHLMQNNSIDSLINFYYLPNIDYSGGGLTGYGQAFNTPGNELFVAGNECSYIEENIACYDLANTFIPIHELGHCLGLLHTHPGSHGEENVIRNDDESSDTCEVNCEISADLLCDTEASTVLKNKVTFDGYDCTYIENEVDSCGYAYEPQIDNYMSYTHFECANAFTQEQIDKMFLSIEHNNMISQTNIEIGDMNDDLTINVLDALILVNTILYTQNISDLYLWLGDINNDTTIDIVDIILLINIILD